jgi:hypothetical protein
MVTLLAVLMVLSAASCSTFGSGAWSVVLEDFFSPKPPDSTALFSSVAMMAFRYVLIYGKATPIRIDVDKSLRTMENCDK